MIIEELVALLGFELKGEGALKRFRDGIEGATRKLAEFARAAARYAAAAAAALASGASFLAKAAISTGAEFEKLRVQLEALEGSSEKAEDALKWIRQFAKDTPLDLQSTVKAYASLRNFGIDPTNGSLMALVDTMAMSGKGAEHLDGLVLALGQAWTKGKLQGEEALQLIERGVPVWDLLSKATGKSTAELIKLSSAGKLGRDVIQLLIDQMGQRAAGASAKMAKTWEGITGRLEDSWQQFKLAVADAGWFEWVKERLEGLEEWIEGLWKSGTLDRLAGYFSETFIAVGESLMRFGRLALRIAKWIGRQFEALGGVIADGLRYLTGGTIDLSNLQALAALGAVLLAVFAPWTTALIAAFLVLDDLLAYLEGSNSVIGQMIDKLSEMTDALNEFAPGLGDAVSEGINAIKAGDWSGAGRAALDAFLAVWNGTTVGAYLNALTEPLQTFFSGLYDQVASFDLSDWFDRLAGSFDNVQTALAKLGGGLADIWAAFSKSEGGSTVLASVNALVEVLGRLVGATILAGLEGVVGTLQNLAIALGAWGEALSKVAQGDLLGAFSALGQGIIDIAANIATSLERMFQAFVPSFSFEMVADELDRLFDYILSWIESINLFDAGVRLIESLFDGMKSIGAAIRDWFSSLIPEWARGWVVNTEPVEAPSSTAVDPSQMHNRFAPASSNTEPVEAPSSTAVDPSQMHNRFAPANSNIATDAQQNLDKVTGDQAIDQTVNQVANDNRVTNVEVNAPVSIHATTNATAGEIGSMAGNAVRSAGRDATRSLAVTGAAGGGGPR